MLVQVLVQVLFKYTKLTQKHGKWGGGAPPPPHPSTGSRKNMTTSVYTQWFVEHIQYDVPRVLSCRQFNTRARILLLLETDNCRMAERGLVAEPLGILLLTLGILLGTLSVGILLFTLLPECVLLLKRLADRGNVRPQKPLTDRGNVRPRNLNGLADRGNIGRQKPLNGLADRGNVGLQKPLKGLADRGNVGLQKHGLRNRCSPRVDNDNLIRDIGELYDDMAISKKRPTRMTHGPATPSRPSTRPAQFSSASGRCLGTANTSTAASTASTARASPSSTSRPVSSATQYGQLREEDDEEPTLRMPITQAAGLLFASSLDDPQNMTPGERRLLRMAKSFSYNDVTVCAVEMHQNLFGRRRVRPLRQWQSAGDSPCGSPIDDNQQAENDAPGTIVRQALFV